MTSKAAAKKAETEAFTARVKAALEKAHAAATEATTEFVKTAKKDDRGLVADACGGGYVVVYKPSYRLRVALKALKATNPPPYRGGWDVSNFMNDVPKGTMHSLQATNLAIHAAWKVLKAELAGEGEFFPKTYID